MLDRTQANRTRRLGDSPPADPAVKAEDAAVDFTKLVDSGGERQEVKQVRTLSDPKAP